jgi:16S rRNA (adenine1518-N6/adenine1519-N6)-dimethyltransferase
VGNLPYNAATAILTRFLLEPIPWDRLVLMFQLEVGQKLMGKPGEKAYGPLSILAQLTCRMTRLLKLGPGSFHPPPKVDSVVLLFEPKPGALPQTDRKALLDLLHRSFAHRRKTLANNWSGMLDPATTRAILAAEGLDPSIRAEAVPPTKWVELLACLESLNLRDSSIK